MQRFTMVRRLNAKFVPLIELVGYLVSGNWMKYDCVTPECLKHLDIIYQWILEKRIWSFMVTGNLINLLLNYCVEGG